ncbi:hypothetical protein [Fusibacter sp. 3D3]|uniref:hypothetical protein n=1 Tax=Fusibacter sp. 3D3 TaxID=1048380 RepID=UPI000852CB27|nr:hypothetical protein [Fusibacter sp. 3D3]GAU77500.1 hypothetical protein F3D3_2129 [Fusibacter sp. 3D3]
MKIYDEIEDQQVSNIIKEKEPNLEPEIPKFIRGPTEYKKGQFRHIREGPKNPSEVLDKISMQAENGQRKPVEYEKTLESPNAKLFIGKVSEDQKVILSTRKNDNNGNSNTYKHANIDMQRASALYRRRYTTFTENMDDAFCHFVSETDPTGNFMAYLERASSAAETEDIKTIFPFLGHSDAVQKLNELFLERDQIKSNLGDAALPIIREATVQINTKIDQLRQEIYDNQFKRAQFIKRLDQLFESKSDQAHLTDDEKSEYWLWVWLKKLLNALKEKVEEAEVEAEIFPVPKEK